MNNPRLAIGFVTSNNKMFDTLKEAYTEELNIKLIEDYSQRLRKSYYTTGFNANDVIDIILKYKDLVKEIVNG